MPPKNEAGKTRGAPDADADALVEGLDRLRDALLQRLDQIEALAADQADLLTADTSEREQTLRERVTVLETAHSRLQAEVKRRELEWQTALREIEDDRRLLIEAWGRLESEQTEAPALAAAAAAAQATAPGPRATAAPTHGEPGRDDAVTRDILWQFQALKNDVRSSAKGASGR